MKEKEKWFSWGWLVFLFFIVEPFFALIYLIVKSVKGR